MNNTDLGVDGVNFCLEAYLARLNDQPMDPVHTASCPVCIRRRRMSQAEVYGIEPLQDSVAFEIADALAREYIGLESGIDRFTTHAFYLTMVKNQELEDFFAACVEAYLSPIQVIEGLADCASARWRMLNNSS